MFNFIANVLLLGGESVDNYDWNIKGFRRCGRVVLFVKRISLKYMFEGFRGENEKMAVSRVASRLSPANSVLLVCDIQEKFRPTIKYFEEIIQVSKRLILAANLLDMKIVATEQYPKGLGHTVSELDLNKYNIPVFEKKRFSMCIPSVTEVLQSPKSVILCGIEAHVCVLHTVLDMLEKNIAVHVVADAVSSRSQTDRMFGLRQMENAGAVLTTSECAILGLLGGADHPKFREVQKIIMDLAPDTGLMQCTL
uniref:Isochorismatase domain-containing protein 1 n=1 Tax=Setaria digitata TaxID=48799 RepID=A0A915PH38_9BILA